MSWHALSYMHFTICMRGRSVTASCIWCLKELQVAEARKRGDIGERTNQGQTTVKLTTIEAEVQRENNLRHDPFPGPFLHDDFISLKFAMQAYLGLAAGSLNIGTLPLFMKSQEDLLLNWHVTSQPARVACCIALAIHLGGCPTVS